MPSGRQRYYLWLGVVQPFIERAPGPARQRAHAAQEV